MYYWGSMDIELIRQKGKSFSYIVRAQGLNVGRIHISISNESATIEDINVGEIRFKPYWFFPFKRTISYRGKGYGSALLKTAINHCREIGVKEILGVMHGDEVKLAKLYKRHGFAVNYDHSIYLSI